MRRAFLAPLGPLKMPHGRPDSPSTRLLVILGLAIGIIAGTVVGVQIARTQAAASSN